MVFAKQMNSKAQVCVAIERIALNFDSMEQTRTSYGYRTIAYFDWLLSDNVLRAQVMRTPNVQPA
jgi:hypothetical protein